MPYDPDDTIAAIATASGGGARGIIRVSGPAALATVDKCFRAADGTSIQSRRRASALCGHVLATLREGEPSHVPCDLLLWPTARSYTRQPVAEFHAIGSTPLMQGALTTLCAAGARLAEPGEFTLRAFLAGRLDLTQAEAVLGVIDADGPSQLDAALGQLAGGLARPLNRLREQLMQLLAELEAGLDFVEDDIEFVSPDQLQDRLGAARALVRETAAQMASRHAGVGVDQVVLTGLPNVGKSSLFNALVAAGDRRPAAASPIEALVSDQRGTTRDYLTATIDLDGVRCELVDTAGLHSAASEAAAAGSSIDRDAAAMTAERCGQASLRALCLEASSAGAGLPRSGSGSGPPARAVDVVVLTKSDLASHERATPPEPGEGVPIVATSSRTGQGLDALRAVLRTLLVQAGPGPSRSRVVTATADRCRESLRLAEAALGRAAQTVAARRGDELVAAELRTALHELGHVVGAVYTDDILDRIFKTFCIGK